MTPKLIFRVIVAAVGAFVALSWSGEPSPTRSFMSEAEAIIGRPATPMSYAGVARRTTRRAVAYGAAAGAAAVTVYPAPTCVQVVNAYGQVVVRCP